MKTSRLFFKDEFKFALQANSIRQNRIDYNKFQTD